MTTIVDIFDVIQQVRDTGTHLKGYNRPRNGEHSRGPQKINDMQKRRRTHVYLRHKATIRLLHNTNSKLVVSSHSGATDHTVP